MKIWKILDVVGHRDDDDSGGPPVLAVVGCDGDVVVVTVAVSANCG